MSKTLVVGIIGTGGLAPAELEATLSDLFAADGIDKVECVFALTDDALGDGAYDAFGFVTENASDDLLAAAVTYADSDNTDDQALHGEAEDKKVRIIPSQEAAAVAVADELVKAKLAGADARLVVFLVTDEADPEADPGSQYLAMETAIQGGVRAFNICTAMDELFLGDEGAPEHEAPAPEPEPAPARRGRRGTAVAAEAPAAAEPAAETPPKRTRGTRAAAEPTLDTAADEAQQPAGPVVVANGKADLSDDAVGDILDAFASIVARKVVEMLAAQAGEETAAAPARRTRRA